MGDYWSEEEIDQLEELRGSGLSFDDIGPSLGRSVHSVKAKWKKVQEYSQFDWEAKARLGSEKLLSALKKHHDLDDVCVERNPDMPAPDLAPEPIQEAQQSNEHPARLHPTIRNIKAAVAKRFGVRPGDIGSHRRTHDIIYPRHIAYYMCRLLTLHSYPEIGRRLGGKDHTSVLHGCRKIEAAAKTDPKIAEDIEAIKCAFDCENNADDAS